MSFLKAKKSVAAVQKLPPHRLRLLASCTIDSIALFLRAKYAGDGVNLEVHTLSYGTLNQHLAGEPDGTDEVALLLPWDVYGSADWRGGVPETPDRVDEILSSAEAVMARIAERCRRRAVYINADIPPLLANRDDQARLKGGLLAIASGAGAVVLGPDQFSLSSYLTSGAPVAGDALEDIASALYRTISGTEHRGKGKVLVTDLDNCLWRGIVGEDGPEHVSAFDEGPSYKHFIYQTYLRRLRGDGVVLAAVSRNDPDLAVAPLRRGQMVLSDHDFLAIEAGYGAKSVAIEKLASDLNLGLDAFVIVDDNPVELAEIGSALPEVIRVRFPSNEGELPAFLSKLGNLFHRDTLTDDDRQRHDFYVNRQVVRQRRAESSSVTEFLAGLNMTLTIFERGPGTWDRAIQLINKTNQFNLNGRRWSEEEVAARLREGGRLLTARLSDDTGDHGEVLTLLMDGYCKIEAFVMSCRAFQRQAEFAFLLALKNVPSGFLVFDYQPTTRNTPFKMFLDEPAFSGGDGAVTCDMAALRTAHLGDLALFDIRFGDDDSR